MLALYLCDTKFFRGAHRTFFYYYYYYIYLHELVYPCCFFSGSSIVRWPPQSFFPLFSSIKLWLIWLLSIWLTKLSVSTSPNKFVSLKNWKRWQQLRDLNLASIHLVFKSVVVLLEHYVSVLFWSLCVNVDDKVLFNSKHVMMNHILPLQISWRRSVLNFVSVFKTQKTLQADLRVNLSDPSANRQDYEVLLTRFCALAFGSVKLGQTCLPVTKHPGEWQLYLCSSVTLAHTPSPVDNVQM